MGITPVAAIPVAETAANAANCVTFMFKIGLYSLPRTAPRTKQIAAKPREVLKNRYTTCTPESEWEIAIRLS